MLLRRNFTEWGKGQTEQEIKESYLLYIDRLRHLPVEFIQLAALRHIDTATFFPKISELLQPAEAKWQEAKERVALERRIAERERQALEDEKKRALEPPLPRVDVSGLLKDLYASLAENKMRQDRQRKEFRIRYTERQKVIARRIMAEEKPEEVEE